MKATRRRGKVERIVGGVLLLLFLSGLGLTLTGGSRPSVARSVGTPLEFGRMGAFLVLERLAIEVQAWGQAPRFLPQDGGVLWLPKRPTSSLARPLSAGLDANQDPRSPVHYGAFVRAGGTLILPFSVGNLDWLRDDCFLLVPDWQPSVRTGEFDVELESGARLPLDVPPLEDGPDADDDPDLNEQIPEPVVETARESSFAPEAEWFDFAVDEGGAPFVSWSAQGAGRVVLLANDRWLENGSLGLESNAELLVRFVESVRTPGPLLFDEFALGLGLRPSKLDLATSPGLLGVTVQALLVSLIFVLMYAWVREFPRDPEKPRLDPRLRVQAQVAWMERAGRFDLLAADLMEGVLARLLRQLGLRAAESKLSTQQRRKQDLEALATRLSPALAHSPWRSLFSQANIHSKHDLDQLGSQLLAFESEVLARTSSVPSKPSK